MTLETVDADGTEYDIISYDATVPSVEVTTTQPFNAQEYLAYKFILYRDATEAGRRSAAHLEPIAVPLGTA